MVDLYRTVTVLPSQYILSPCGRKNGISLVNYSFVCLFSASDWSRMFSTCQIWPSKNCLNHFCKRLQPGLLQIFVFIKYCEVPQKELWRIAMVKETIRVRDNELVVPGFSNEECEDILNYLCVTWLNLYVGYTLFLHYTYYMYLTSFI